MSERVEIVTVEGGVRTVLIARARKAPRPPTPLARVRSGVGSEPAETVFARMPSDQRSWATRLLTEGLGRWRRWSTIVRNAGDDFSPLAAEAEVVPILCRAGLLTVRERPTPTGDWRPVRFTTSEHVAEELGIVRPEALRAALLEELVDDDLRAEALRGPTGGMRWASFAIVLRAATQYRDLVAHGRRPRPRELAGKADHTKVWQPARQELLARLLGDSWDELFPRERRQIAVRGPINNPELSVWTEGVSDVPLRLRGELLAIVCVENKETFQELWPLSSRGWVVLHVPGMPPPAEVEFLSRLYALARVPVYAAFDPDPAGIKIVRTLSRRADVPLRMDVMTPQLLAAANSLELNEWDRAELERQRRGGVGELEPLRAAIEASGRKGEQEPAHEWLVGRLEELDAALRAGPA